ncbi:MAG: redoxin domain-containing protein [bacterium]|jgi:peroxiredoxin|nr:redoxin domain-containing protein [Phycisphaerales bacterium]MCE2652062.1 redoxin domain-containing protein [Planctomycetaceae bacterium]
MSNDALKPRDSFISKGEVAPDFVLKAQNRADWKLSDALKNGDVVLCFYPMDFSPVCSTEMKCANDELAKWSAKGAQVVGISCDSFFVHEAWAQSLNLKQTLLADMHRQVCKAYGIYWPDLNISGRGTVIVGRDGKVKWSQKREIKDAFKAEELAAAIG